MTGLLVTRRQGKSHKITYLPMTRFQNDRSRRGIGDKEIALPLAKPQGGKSRREKPQRDRSYQ